MHNNVFVIHARLQTSHLQFDLRVTCADDSNASGTLGSSAVRSKCEFGSFYPGRFCRAIQRRKILVTINELLGHTRSFWLGAAILS